MFISTGELSGDMHAAKLVTAWQALRQSAGLPPPEFHANGSRALKEAGAQLLHDVADWSEMGIVANLLKAGHFRRVHAATVRRILELAPRMVVLVDNRVFNTALAEALRRRGYSGRIVYYVAPVRWEAAHDPGEQQKSLENPRFLKVRELCDFAIPIYPVSLETYRALQIPHEYFGHPLCDKAGPTLGDAEFARASGIDPGEGDLLVGALPGSRRGEIEQIAPAIFGGLSILHRKLAADRPPRILHVVVPLAHPDMRQMVLNAALNAGLHQVQVVDQSLTWDIMYRADLMLVKSGTGLHQCVIAGVPSVMCYRVHPFAAFIARHLLKFSLPHYGLPNIIAGRTVVPELIQDECNAGRIAAEAERLLTDDAFRERMLRELAEVRRLICRDNALERIARAVNEVFESQVKAVRAWEDSNPRPADP